MGNNWYINHREQILKNMQTPEYKKKRIEYDTRYYLRKKERLEEIKRKIINGEKMYIKNIIFYIYKE
jgi:hypothetical protein